MLNLTFVQLEYIVALDTFRHFVSAAQACHVTQPTLSMQIKKLEEVIGVKLFDRSRQPIIPTDAGKQIIAQARIIMRETTRIEDIVQEYKGIISGELKIGIIPTLASSLIPRFLGDFGRKFPKVKLHIYELFTHQIVEELKRETLDAGILVTPLKENGILENKLFYEEILAYVAPDSPFIEKQGLEIGDLSGQPMWLLSEGHCFRDQGINLCGKSLPKDTSFEYESGSLETLVKIVDREGGITILPELASFDLRTDQKKQLKLIGNDHPSREVSLVYVRNYAKKRLLRVLEDIIQASVPDSLRKEDSVKVVEWK